ncbi:Protocadherin Fat 1 [Portunus trituberculatus]|uniref:Protocadherin Fat 1 n=1 Tax=Portunus trituberculatus TaxID=210409 RepID=A0A5B7DP79_PORTR|nr:Protocadherin Fat 1 [Portunus trituberculatus]
MKAPFTAWLQLVTPLRKLTSGRPKKTSKVWHLQGGCEQLQPGGWQEPYKYCSRKIERLRRESGETGHCGMETSVTNPLSKAAHRALRQELSVTLHSHTTPMLVYMNGTSISSKANGHTNGHIKHANGHANGKANGVANGYSNGHANGHANGTIHYRGSSTKETNGHIPQTEDTSINARVSARDVDTGMGGSVRYSCADECDGFDIRSTDGVVVLTKQLDAEVDSHHELVAVATDSGIPQLSATARLNFHVSNLKDFFVRAVVDFNDNPPMWRQDSYSCRVSAEAQPGHVVTSMSASDPDAGQIMPLRYAIHSGDQSGIFKMDSLTGVLTVTAPHKLENVTSLNLNMSVTDGVHMVFKVLHVAIVPSNHHAPRFNRTLYEAYVEENSSPGQLVTNLLAYDPDTGGFGTLHYSILHQTSEGAFAIDKEGNLFTERQLDRESLALHTLKLSVIDEGGRASFTTVRLIIHDKNDNPPIFTLPEYQSNINTDVAPGTTILKVEADDADEGLNSEVEYRMYEANSSEALKLFAVDSLTGEVTITQSLQGRETEVYQFFIRGEDKGSPPHHSDVPITIFLLPAYESPPHCAKKYAQFFMREDDPVGNVIATLWMEGPQEVQYSIVADEDTEQRVAGKEKGSGESSGPFAVTSTGLVVTRKSLDHERRRIHRITVTNHTLMTPPTVDYMTISVMVMDVNDCSPRFSEMSYTTLVAENSELGDVITILTATDEDEGNNGQPLKCTYVLKHMKNS